MDKMETTLRKREKQLATALKAMREVSESIEALVRGGPIVIEAADCLEFAAKLLAARSAIMAEHVVTVEEAAPRARAKRASTADEMSPLGDTLRGALTKPLAFLPN
jgi:hypothetical protein